MTIRVLLALATGLGAGAVVAATQSPLLLRLPPLIEPVGTLWLNALRMTVIPLIISLLVTGMSAARGNTAARGVPARTLTLVMLLLAAGAAFAGVLGPILMQLWPIDAGTAGVLTTATLRSVTVTAPEVPSLADWVTALIPSNAIGSAADGAVLPLVFFSVILGLAVTRLSEESRASLLGFFGALGEAMLVIVQWVLRVAPLGVFALVFPMAASSGIQLAGALMQYLVLSIALCIIATLALYPLIGTAGGMSVRMFARAAAPAQAVALSTRSSLASLPAMLDSARHLGIPTSLSGVVLPLAVTLMRFCSPLLNVFKVVFVAALLGTPLEPLQIVIAGVMAAALSLAAVGLPSEVTFMAMNVPVFQAVGLPLEPLALLLAVEAIPDMFKTMGNVTADLAVTSLVAHGRQPVLEDGPIPAVV